MSHTRRARSLFFVAALLGLAFVGAGCTTAGPGTSVADAPTASTAATGTAVRLPAPNGAWLPPNDEAALAALYDEALAPSGVRMSHAALVDTTGGGYDASDQGTHLALYVRPVRKFDPDDYAKAFWSTAALLGPDAFARWRGLASFDVCIERWADLGEVSSTTSQVNITRTGLDAVDWSSGSIDDLITAARRADGVEIHTDAPLTASPLWQAADRRATERVGPDPRPGTSLPTILAPR